MFFDEKRASGAESATPQAASDATDDELQRTREQLDTAIEQYESALEELKASNEQLRATNEELRSATEELEVNQEELQSVNVELTSLTNELKLKVNELSQANSDLQNLMSSTEIGMLFVDRQLRITRFTRRTQDLFNLIPTDIGRPLAHVTHRLEINDLPDRAQLVLRTLRATECEVTSRDAGRYSMRLLPYRTHDDHIAGVVMTFVDVARSEERLRHALEIAPIVMFSIGPSGPTWACVSGAETPVERAIEMFAEGHAERLMQIARDVLQTKQGQRAELELIIDQTKRTFDFRIEATARGVDIVGFDITPRK